MYLIEIYKSVQGESSFAGLPCIFVRLAGCNLRCSWCDSEYTFTGGYKQTPEEVEAAIAALAPVRLVEFTGGEPMLQTGELVSLMRKLIRDGYELLLETSGERPLAEVPPQVHKIVDVKCPGSGEAAGSFRIENIVALTRNDEVKFVISDRADYEFARDFIREHGLGKKVGAVLLSPAWKKNSQPERTTANCALDPKILVEWMLADGLPTRLSLQIHKYIWEPQVKGV
jgi:7-carboxy-7-deazaguanine synthase